MLLPKIQRGVYLTRGVSRTPPRDATLPFMPELPEVQTVVARLDAALRGKRVSSVILMRRDIVKREPRNLPRLLGGRTILGIERHGKRIIWRLEPAGELNVHLGMTGHLALNPVRAPLERHTHLRIRLRGVRQEVRFVDSRRFGGVWWSGSGHPSTPLGPDALRVRLPEFRTILSRRRQIKALLLDQTALAGLGNIYSDEALHRARIHPLTSASDLDDDRVRNLLGCIRQVLRAAIRARGSTIRDYVDADGGRGGYQARHGVYGREGLPCPRCGVQIERITVASRSTRFCPRCQDPAGS
jgi:formamidopyrimidine-DNA glycosylase